MNLKVNLMSEDIIWKVINRFKGLYEFSSNGYVRCLPKAKNGNREIITKGSICSGKKKYYVIYVTDIHGIRKQEKVHRLIGEAHIPNPLSLPLINHDDNDGLNNNVYNLEWTTDLGNKEHAKNTGRIPKGEDNLKSKLSSNDVSKINTAKNTQSNLAIEYGVKQSTISSIKLGRTWAHITKNKKIDISPILSKEDVMSIFNSNEKYSILCGLFNIGRNVIFGIKSGRHYSRYTNKEYAKIVKNTIKRHIVLAIYNSGESNAVLSAKYNINASRVSAIKTGFRYSKITGAVYSPTKLNDELILEIFNSELSYKGISVKYGISRKNISAIKTGYRHSNITGKIFTKTRFCHAA